MNASVRWSWHEFRKLAPEVLYAILELRSRVFVVEQNCVFLDQDGTDVHCEHLCGFSEDGLLLAYLRLVPPGLKFPETSLGRVVTHPDFRRRGLARQGMTRGLQRLAERFPGHACRIGAQRYAEAFYASLGFVPTGEPYMEDGIPHTEMIRPG